MTYKQHVHGSQFTLTTNERKKKRKNSRTIQQIREKYTFNTHFIRSKAKTETLSHIKHTQTQTKSV